MISDERSDVRPRTGAVNWRTTSPGLSSTPLEVFDHLLQPIDVALERQFLRQQLVALADGLAGRLGVG